MDNHKTNNRIKISITLDEYVATLLKQRAILEKKSLSEVIQNAVISYFSEETRDINSRTVAARRLLSTPFKVSTAQLKQDIEEDYYDQ